MEVPGMKRAPVRTTDNEALVAILGVPLSPCGRLTPVVAVEDIEHGAGVDDALARSRIRYGERRIWYADDRVPYVDQAGRCIDICPSQRENLADAQADSCQQVPGDLKPRMDGGRQEGVNRVSGPGASAAHCVTPSHSSSAGTGTTMRRPSRWVGKSPRLAAS